MVKSNTVMYCTVTAVLHYHNAFNTKYVLFYVLRENVNIAKGVFKKM